jgi:lactoylglutathione lyase
LTVATVVYVEDVAASLAFYEGVFGLERDHLDDDGSYGELKVGIGFTANWHAQRHLDIPFRRNDPSRDPAGFGLEFVVDDVDATFERALKAEGRAVWPPQEKPWGRAAMFRDPNGVLVQIFRP